MDLTAECVESRRRAAAGWPCLKSLGARSARVPCNGVRAAALRSPAQLDLTRPIAHTPIRIASAAPDNHRPCEPCRPPTAPSRRPRRRRTQNPPTPPRPQRNASARPAKQTRSPTATNPRKSPSPRAATPAPSRPCLRTSLKFSKGPRSPRPAPRAAAQHPLTLHLHQLRHHPVHPQPASPQQWRPRSIRRAYNEAHQARTAPGRSLVHHRKNPVRRIRVPRRTRR